MGRRLRCTLVLLSGLLLLLLADGTVKAGQPSPEKSPADRWTMFRGNLAMTGVSASSLPDQLQLQWTFETKDSIEATAAIFENTVYFTTCDGRCYALNLADGKEIWKFTSPDGDAVKSSLCVTDDLVCYGDDIGVFRALDRKTGELRWHIETGDQVVSSPIYVDGKIIFGSYDQFMYCVHAADGTITWQLETMGPVHCSPSFIDGQVVAAGCDGYIRLISVEKGEETASLEIGGNIVATPAVVGDRMFIGTNDNTVLRVDVRDGLTKQWVYTPPRKFPFFASPALTDDLCVIGGRDKMVHALEQETGKERWNFRTRARVDSSPVIAGHRVVVGSSDGNLYMLDVQTGEKKWEFLTGNAIVAGPAVADGKVVIGNTDGKLFCFSK